MAYRNKSILGMKALRIFNMSSMKNKVFLLMVFFLVLPLQAVRITLLNDPADIAKNQKICLHFQLDADDEGIFKNTLQFSIDHPEVSLVAWNTACLATDFCSSSLRKVRKIFSDSFTGEITLKNSVHDIQEQEHYFQNTKLYVSCFYLRKNGKVKPMNTMLHLGSIQTTPDANSLFATNNLTTTMLTSTGLLIHVPKPLSTPDFEQAFQPIEYLAGLWGSFCGGVKDIIFGPILCWLVVACVFLLMLLFVLRHFGWCTFVPVISAKYRKDCWAFFVFCLFNGMLYAARHFCQAILLLYLFATLCAIGMLYAFITALHEDSFLAFIKNCIGILLGSMILPVMLKAYLMQHGL